jgi:hypothetical protein
MVSKLRRKCIHRENGYSIWRNKKKIMWKSLTCEAQHIMASRRYGRIGLQWRPLANIKSKARFYGQRLLLLTASFGGGDSFPALQSGVCWLVPRSPWSCIPKFIPSLGAAILSSDQRQDDIHGTSMTELRGSPRDRHIVKLISYHLSINTGSLWSVLFNYQCQCTRCNSGVTLTRSQKLSFRLCGSTIILVQTYHPYYIMLYISVCLDTPCSRHRNIRVRHIRVSQ